MNKTMAAAEINAAFSHWIDSVVELTSSLLGQLASSPTVHLVEDENAEFVLHVNGKIDTPNFERIRIVEGKIERKTSAIAAAPRRCGARSSMRCVILRSCCSLQLVCSSFS